MFSNSQKKLLDVLVESGKIRPAQVDEWRNLSNFDIEKKLKAEQMISQEDLSRSYATLYSLPFEKLPHQKIALEILQFIGEDLARKYKIIPYSYLSEKQSLKVGLADPANLNPNLNHILQELKHKKGIEIQLAIITPDDFSRQILGYQEIPPRISPSENETKINVQLQPPAPISSSSTADIKTVELGKINIPLEVISKFPEDIARKYQMVVFEAPHPSLIKVALADPQNKKVREIIDFIEEKNDIAIDEYQAPLHEIIASMKFYHPQEIQVKIQPEASSVSLPQKEKTPEVISGNFASMNPPANLKPQAEVRQYVVKPKVNQPPRPSAQPITQPPAQPFVSKYVVSKYAKEAVPVVKSSQAEASAIVGPQEADLDNFLGEDIKEVSQLQTIAETGHIPKMVAAMIALAVYKKASDIHLEPEKTDIRIRYRVDGILRDIIKLPLERHPAMISRIKILSKLKIDESRVPQDGRFDVKAQGHEIDLRISTLPTIRGEKVAMRILDKSLRMYNLEELGVTGQNLKVLTSNIDKPYGIILSVGPTGCGKSTTLYAVLNRISTASVNIITLEDPVEYEISGINQCQIKPKIGFTFANGLRSVLRQDPNIIMVGEIRDAETASLATHAALTGHLVLSSLHTNDASGALPRLINMGIEPFLITSSINAIIGQRLVRRLCPKCKKPAHIPDLVLRDIEKELSPFNLQKPLQFFEGRGCPECDQGYHGRVGIFEVLAMSDKIEILAIARRPSSEIKAEAFRSGMISMKQDGLNKALKGITTVNEVLRVITS